MNGMTPIYDQLVAEHHYDPHAGTHPTQPPTTRADNLPPRKTGTTR